MRLVLIILLVIWPTLEQVAEPYPIVIGIVLADNGL